MWTKNCERTESSVVAAVMTENHIYKKHALACITVEAELKAASVTDICKRSEISKRSTVVYPLTLWRWVSLNSITKPQNNIFKFIHIFEYALHSRQAKSWLQLS